MKLFFIFLILTACQIQSEMTGVEKQTLASYENQIKMGREKSFSPRQKSEYKELKIKQLQQPDSTSN
jgi:hypothetical protein